MCFPSVAESYVIVGCHYDSWTYGAVDPSTGVALLMELAKAFDKLSSNGINFIAFKHLNH